MLPPWTWTASAVAAALGPLSHYLVWMRFELDGVFYKFVPLILLFQPLSVFLLFRSGLSFIQSTIISWILQSIYIITLFVSISIYRLYFHPTKKFPGPFWAKLSSAWKIKIYNEGGQQGYKAIDALHKTYGDAVRIGPRHISINHIDAVAGIYGNSSDCWRGVQSEVGKLKHVQAMRDKEHHRLRRLMWDQGLNARACHQYLSRMSHIADFFVERLKLYKGREVNIADWMHYYTFDVMGELGFGQSYGQIESGQLHPAIAAIHDQNRYALSAIQVPWLSNIVGNIPGLQDPIAALMKISEQSLTKREKEEPEYVDIMSFILKPATSKSSDRYPMDRETLVQDSMLMQIAASDTSYSILAYLFYYLVKFPNLQADLRAEIEPAFEGSEGGVPVWSKLHAAPLLESMFMETMRHNPAVPQGMTRQTRRDQGAQIGPTFVPADTIVSVPTWSVHHDERYWVDPYTWRPERWTTNPELIKDKRAWIPFSVGPTQCPGKYFAVMETKVLLAKVVRAFNLEFAQGEDGSGMIERNRDWLTTNLPPLRLKMIPRDQPKEKE